MAVYFFQGDPRANAADEFCFRSFARTLVREGERMMEV